MTATQFGDAEATRVISAIETRLNRKIKDGALTSTTWGTVQAVSTNGKEADVFLYGETVVGNVSGGFRIPDTMALTAGDVVKVSINYSTGERWIEEASVASSYKKVAVDVANGKVLLGSGSLDMDITLFREGAGYLVLEATGAATDSTIAVRGSTRSQITARATGDTFDRMILRGDTIQAGIQFGSGTATVDTFLYRAAADVLRTDDAFRSRRAAATDEAFGAQLISNTVMPFVILADGTMEWGSGTGVRDVVLSRAAANKLELQDQFNIGTPETAAGSGVFMRTTGSVEIVANAGTAYIDFKRDATVDFEARIAWAGTNLDLQTVSFNISTAGQSYKHSGTQVVGSRKTGWANPTGTATRTTYATTTVTVAQLAERVKGLIDDLMTHGLIGA